MNRKFNTAVIIIFAIMFIILALMAGRAKSADWRAYTEIGGMNVTEQGISEGHKAYHLLGMETELSSGKNAVTIGLEGFYRMEPKDEDWEIPCTGAAVFAEYQYQLFGGVNPYIGIRYDHLSRGTAPKYEHSTYGQETEHDIVSATAGVHLLVDGANLYVDIGTSIPFYTSTKSGNFGPDIGVGFKWRSLDVGYRYKQIRLTDHHLQGGDSLSFYWSGVQVGWSF